MKTLLKVTVLTILLILSACEKNELSDSSSSIKDGKTINGKIVNFTTGEFNSLQVYYDGDDKVIAEGSVSSNGEFSIPLPAPSNLVNITDFLYPGFDGEISDKGAFVSSDDFSFWIEAYKGNDYVGYVFKGNSDIFEDWSDPPFSVSLFIYSDRKTTVKSQYISDKNLINYDFTLYKGWNELVWKVISYNSRTALISDVITDDMKWKYSNEEN